MRAPWVKTQTFAPEAASAAPEAASAAPEATGPHPDGRPHRPVSMCRRSLAFPRFVALAVRDSPCLRLKMAVGKLQYVRYKSKHVHGPRPIWNISAKVTYLPIRMNQRVPPEDGRSPGRGSQRSSVNSFPSTPMIQSMSSANTSLQSSCSTERFHRCWRVSCWRQNWHCQKQLC